MVSLLDASLVDAVTVLLLMLYILHYSAREQALSIIVPDKDADGRESDKD